ncbi:glycosyl transferase family 90-domain-containing protein [Cryomyces antarcticus]
MAVLPLRKTLLTVTGFAVLCLLLVAITSTRLSVFPQARQTETVAWPVTQVQHDQPILSDSWSFNYTRDARNYGLSASQCDAAFPQLYVEIDRAVAHRRQSPITVSEVETDWRGDGIVRALIHSNQLYVVENRGVSDANHRPRSLAVLHSLHRAITATDETLPDIEFTLTDHDSADIGDVEHTTWAFARLPEQEKLWLMPDFNFWAWPGVGIRSFAELRDKIEEEEVDFVDREMKLVWRGSVDVAAHDVRAALLRQSMGKEWSDVQSLDWSNRTDVDTKLLSMDEHCGYAFVAQTEGNTYSGRLKYLLLCSSLLLTHPLRFIEHFTHLLSPTGPQQNHVQLRRDFVDLPSTMDHYLAHPDRAALIADNARRTFRERYLTPAAEACYWRRLVRGWAEVSFTPRVREQVEVVDRRTGGTKVVSRRRGVPFESYAIMEAVEWEVPPRPPRKMCEDGQRRRCADG